MHILVTIAKVSILVGEEFVKKNICSNVVMIV
jgi:hypothetical protein